MKNIYQYIYQYQDLEVALLKRQWALHIDGRPHCARH